jgi:hypothetical protein
MKNGLKVLKVTSNQKIGIPTNQRKRNMKNCPFTVMFSSAGALLRAALVANCFLGAFPPVDLRAVCFVRAIALYSLKLNFQRE